MGGRLVEMPGIEPGSKWGTVTLYMRSRFGAVFETWGSGKSVSNKPEAGSAC